MREIIANKLYDTETATQIVRGKGLYHTVNDTWFYANKTGITPWTEEDVITWAQSTKHWWIIEQFDFVEA